MDHLTAALIVELQLHDINELRELEKGKQIEGTVSDKELALSTYENDLLSNRLTLDDWRIGVSMSQAVQADAAIIATARMEEDSATSDRQLACSLGGVESSTKPSLQDLAFVNVADDDFVESLSRLNVTNQSINLFGPKIQDPQVSSSKSLIRYSTSKITTSPCVSCQENKYSFDTTVAPCGHEYCRDCVRQHFEAATKDESLYPPRCCRETIPLASVEDFLEANFIKAFKAKAIEFSTPNRTYCAQPTCSTFIPIERIVGDVGSCPSCGFQTCTTCKGSGHSGECPNDTNFQSLLALASESGWMRCYSCHRMVELNIGCNHMICLCRAEFCYACGLRWKECLCALWDDDRLLARATQVEERDNRPHNAQVRGQRVQQMVENLRERHECNHARWRYVEGPHQCEECHYSLPQYIFECRQCRLQACNRCRRNRL